MCPHVCEFLCGFVSVSFQTVYLECMVSVSVEACRGLYRLQYCKPYTVQYYYWGPGLRKAQEVPLYDKKNVKKIETLRKKIDERCSIWPLTGR